MIHFCNMDELFINIILSLHICRALLWKHNAIIMKCASCNLKITYTQTYMFKNRKIPAVSTWIKKEFTLFSKLYLYRWQMIFIMVQTNWRTMQSANTLIAWWKWINGHNFLFFLKWAPHSSYLHGSTKIFCEIYLKWSTVLLCAFKWILFLGGFALTMHTILTQV